MSPTAPGNRGLFPVHDLENASDATMNRPSRVPPRHACRFTIDSGRTETCPYGCGEKVATMECENPACTSTAPGFCMCQQPDY